MAESSSVRHGRVFGVCGVFAAILVATVVVLVPPSLARASLGGSLTRMFLDGEAGTYVVGNQQLTFDSFTANPVGGDGMVRFAINSGEHNLQLWLAPPPGTTALTVGTYENAQRASFRTAGHPGIDLFGDGKGCNTVTGRFIVDDVSVSGTTLLTFSARFEFHCEGADPVVSGSVSYNSVADFRTVAYSAQALNFGTIGSGTNPMTETLTNNGPSALTITKLAISGPNADQFVIAGSTCGTVAPGQTCAIDVRFAPTGAAGTRSAKLVIFDDIAPESGSGRRVALTGVATLTQGEFIALTPVRILDTRDGTGGYNTPIGAGQTIDVQVTSVGGVPASGVGAVVFNATAVNPSRATYLTVWPAGIAQPANSNINVVAGETRPNLVTVAVGAGGQVSLFNNAGSTDAIFDIVGFYTDASGPQGSRFHPVDPFRLFDTRSPAGGAAAAPIGPGGVLPITVTGVGPVPSGTTAVVLNVTVTGPTSAGYLTVFPGDVSPPTASNLNFVPNETVPNLVVVRVPASGEIDFLNSGGNTHVIADVVGYYDGNRSGGAGRFIGLAPARILDTRPSAALGGSVYGILPIVGRGNVPAGASAAILNVTVTGTTQAGFLTVFPDDNCTIPLASNLNFNPNDSVANSVVVRLSTSTACAAGAGFVDIYNSAGTTHVIVDVFGYFTGA
jgi:hypothetical protein